MSIGTLSSVARPHHVAVTHKLDAHPLYEQAGDGCSPIVVMVGVGKNRGCYRTHCAGSRSPKVQPKTLSHCADNHKGVGQVGNLPERSDEERLDTDVRFDNLTYELRR
jgi:hypothetical protein